AAGAAVAETAGGGDRDGNRDPQRHARDLHRAQRAGQRGDVGSGGGLQPADVLHRGRVRLVGGTRAGGYGCARGQRLRKDIGRRGRGPRSSPACGAGRDGARSDAAPSGMTPGTAPSPTLRRTRGRWSRATESGFRSFPRLRGKAGMGAGSDAKLSGTAPGTAPSPALPRTRGRGHGRRSRGSAPSPACGGRPGWGPAPTRDPAGYSTLRNWPYSPSCSSIAAASPTTMIDRSFGSKYLRAIPRTWSASTCWIRGT